jgi:hypothetical protein
VQEVGLSGRVLASAEGAQSDDELAGGRGQVGMAGLVAEVGGGLQVVLGFGEVGGVVVRSLWPVPDTPLPVLGGAEVGVDELIRVAAVAGAPTTALTTSSPP